MSQAYVFDLRLVCGGYGYFSTNTMGSKPDSDGLEYRTPGRVDKERCGAALRELGLNFVWVDDDSSYYEWTCVQGWAIVCPDYARKHMSYWLKKRKCLISPYGSFTDIEISAPSIRRRSFRGKFKKRILERDGNKCILCGCLDNLTLQHVRPHSKGGETSFRNLVTLCGTCNQAAGAETHRELYEIAGLKSWFEPSLTRSSDGDERAMVRALQLSSNMMHSRCELY